MVCAPEESGVFWGISEDETDGSNSDTVVGLIYNDEPCVVPTDEKEVFLVLVSEDEVIAPVDNLTVGSLCVVVFVSGRVLVELRSVENTGVPRVHHDGIGGIDNLGLCGILDFDVMGPTVEGKFRFSCEGK